jgi:hypothetical protein
VSTVEYTPITSEECDAHEFLGPTKRWICDFVGQPNARANKEGPICPGIPAAYKNDSMYLRLLSTPVDRDNMIALCRTVANDFVALPPTSPPARLLKAVFLVVAAPPRSAAIALVDSVHRHLKAQLLKNGILLGKFHDELVRGSIYNPHFNPHRAPVPLVAFRYLIETDLDFLLSSDATVSERAEYLAIFLSLHRSTASAAAIAKAEAALQTLKREA